MMMKNRTGLSSFLLIAVLCASFAVSLLFWMKSGGGARYVFVFPRTHGSERIIESRRLPLTPYQGKYEKYVAELLLGPLSEQTSPVFSGEPKLLSCFERSGVLYVNISSDFIAENALTADFKRDINLFKKNIKLNFPYLKRVELFIDGKTPFGE
ncbi:MAG: GerMN domain-containing protein [Treponema sp.]